MPHTCTPDEANTLHYLAQALRPDWRPNRPGATWQKVLGIQKGQPMTLTHAKNFMHCINALITYATEPDPQDPTRPKWRTPNSYLADGNWWTTTQPAEAAPNLPPCPQHELYGDIENCKACLSEYKAGTRPHDKIGKVFEPPTTS